VKVAGDRSARRGKDILIKILLIAALFTGFVTAGEPQGHDEAISNVSSTLMRRKKNLRLFARMWPVN